MNTAMPEIKAFLAAIVPFCFLTDAVIEQIVNEISICYQVKGQPLPPKGVNEPRVYIVRKGALSYFSAQGELLGKYGESDVCTVFCVAQPAMPITVKTEEDTLLYSIPYVRLASIIKDHPQVSSFFIHSAEQRLSRKMTEVNEQAILASSLINTTVSQFYSAPVASIAQNMTIMAAAAKMTDLGFSCLVVTQDDSAVATPVGIVTDKDIRRRCVAQGMDTNSTIDQIMTREMLTLDVNSTAYDAMMMMTSKHIHHLPITRYGALAGMVTVTDLINNEGHNALNLISMIHKAHSLAELTAVSRLLPKLQIRMEKQGTTADHVGKSISAITMAFTIALIKMAEQIYGPAPVPYAWMAAGSQARQEQLAHSDQDNALIISDEMQPQHRQWFEDLATFVCDGLAGCGFIHCPGDVMATNSQWRQPQKVWGRYFSQWINTPDPKALLNCSVFFDLTTVYGDVRLLADIRQQMLGKSRQNTLFIAHLSANALNFRPPLGFFRDFVLIPEGDNKQTLDLKHNGIAPIVDLARIYALSQGIAATNTIERLQQAAGTPALTAASAASLIDAYQFLTMLRLQHQAQRIRDGEKPNNYVSPKQISALEREHLKAAFKVIKTLQDIRQLAL